MGDTYEWTQRAIRERQFRRTQKRFLLRAVVSVLFGIAGSWMIGTRWTVVGVVSLIFSYHIWYHWRPTSRCTCGHPLDRHHQFDPGFCRDCGCREYHPNSNQ